MPDDYKDELIETLQELFYEIAIDDGDGWYDTCARTTALDAANRLVCFGVFEQDKSRGYGRRQWFRRIRKPPTPSA